LQAPRRQRRGMASLPYRSVHMAEEIAALKQRLEAARQAVAALDACMANVREVFAQSLKASEELVAAERVESPTLPRSRFS
jgi:hypothetical protein